MNAALLFSSLLLAGNGKPVSPQAIQAEVVFLEVRWPHDQPPLNLAGKAEEVRQRIQELAKTQDVRRVRMFAMTPEESMLESSGQSPMITAVGPARGGPGGGAVRNVQYVSVGNTIRIRPLLQEDGAILMSLNIASSRLAAGANADDPGSLMSEKVVSTFRVPRGEAVCVSETWKEGKEGRVGSIIVVTAEVVPTPGK